MKITREEMRKTRLQLAHEMHNYIFNLGNEDLWNTWTIWGISDEPDEEDFEIYADDGDNFRELCELFGRLVQTDERENN